MKRYGSNKSPSKINVDDELHAHVKAFIHIFLNLCRKHPRDTLNLNLNVGSNSTDYSQAQDALYIIFDTINNLLSSGAKLPLKGKNLYAYIDELIVENLKLPKEFPSENAAKNAAFNTHFSSDIKYTKALECLDDDTNTLFSSLIDILIISILKYSPEELQEFVRLARIRIAAREKAEQANAEGGARKFTRKSRDVSRHYRRTSRVLRGARRTSRKARRGAARRTRRGPTA